MEERRLPQNRFSVGSWKQLKAWPSRFATSVQRLPEWGRLIAIFVAAWLVRLVIALLVIGPTVLGDYGDYSHKASLILAGDFGVPNWPPGYPAFLAVIYQVLGDSGGVVAAVQALLSALTCVFIYLVGRDVFGEAIGFAAAWLSVIYYPLIDYVRYLSTETLFIFLLFGSLALMTGARGSLPRVFVGGVVLGMATLTRPSILAAVPLLIVLGWTRIGLPAEGRLSSLSVTLAGLALALAPWTIRNYVRYGRLITVSSNGAFVAFFASLDHSVYRHELTGDALVAARQITGLESGQTISDFSGPEYEDEFRYYLQEQWRRNPLQQARLRLISAFDFWSPVSRIFFRGMSVGTAYRVSLYSLLLVLTPVGFWKIWRYGLRFSHFLLSPLLGIFLMHVMAVSEERYRLPVEPIMTLFSVYGLSVMGIGRILGRRI